MYGFCPTCRHPLDRHRRCPNVESHPSEAHLVNSQTGLILPKAKPTRRLFGAGIEYSIYAIAQVIIIGLSLATFGVMDALIAAPLILMIAIRDSQSGRFSIEKRLGKMRVVSFGTGQPIDNIQALKRNSYYLLPPILMLLPVLPLDAFLVSTFQLLVALDVWMICFRKDGRRLGDLLAGTQVVPEEQGRRE